MAVKLRDVEPIKLDPALFRPGRVKNRIERVGLEMEGGWDRPPANLNIVHDGSVRMDAEIDRTGRRIQAGEAVSGIMAIEGNTIEEWVTTNFPQYVNNTCGLHIHMSFPKATTYTLLMTPKYDATVLAYVREWAQEEGLPQTHAIFPRLNGQNRYCKLVYDGEAQSRRIKAYDYDSEGNRYTAINRCYLHLKTLEHRYLPMLESPALAISAVRRVIAITNAFLLKTAVREKPAVATVKDDNERLVQTRIERV